MESQKNFVGLGSLLVHGVEVAWPGATDPFRMRRKQSAFPDYVQTPAFDASIVVDGLNKAVIFNVPALAPVLDIFSGVVAQNPNAQVIALTLRRPTCKQ